MEKQKKILIVCPFFPYPTTFGGVYDTWERIKGLSQLNCEIDLLYINKFKPKEDDLAYVKGFVNEVYGSIRKNKWHHLFSIKPLQVVSRDSLRKVNLNKEYDEVILETESVASVLKNKTLISRRKIIRVQNDEAVYFKNLSESSTNLLKKIFYFIEGKKFFYFSREFFKHVDRLWYISADEEEKYKLNTQKENSIHLPSPINTEFILKKPNNKHVLFIGSLYMDNNFEAIQWYLDNIHTDMCNTFDDYVFTICGSTGPYSDEYFRKKVKKHKNIELYLNANKLDDVYSFAAVFVNPMQHGAGVKLKSINAIVNGLPLIATTIGSEGIGLVDKEMFYLANTPKEFLAALKNLLQSSPEEAQNSVIKAQNFLKANNYLNVLKKELSL